VIHRLSSAAEARAAFERWARERRQPLPPETRKFLSPKEIAAWERLAASIRISRLCNVVITSYAPKPDPVSEQRLREVADRLGGLC
jgi:hypothetical protein